MEENTVLENTISKEPEEAVAESVETSTEDAHEGGANNNEANESNEVAPFLEIKFNHESKGLTREEAVKFAQKGMHYEGMYQNLERIADLKGVSVKELINGFETEQDEAYRQELAERFGDDEETIGIMMEHYQQGKQGKIDAAKNKRLQDEAAAEESINTRLANEFIELQKEFPELKEFADLPESVRRAASEGKDLTHAYLLHQHQENKKIAAAKASESKAAAQSTGSLSASKAEDMSEDAFLKGLFSKK
jgi:hypothetical protein